MGISSRVVLNVGGEDILDCKLSDIPADFDEFMEMLTPGRPSSQQSTGDDCNVRGEGDSVSGCPSDDSPPHPFHLLMDAGHEDRASLLFDEFAKTDHSKKSLQNSKFFKLMLGKTVDHMLAAFANHSINEYRDDEFLRDEYLSALLEFAATNVSMISNASEDSKVRKSLKVAIENVISAKLTEQFAN